MKDPHPDDPSDPDQADDAGDDQPEPISGDRPTVPPVFDAIRTLGLNAFKIPPLLPAFNIPPLLPDFKIPPILPDFKMPPILPTYNIPSLNFARSDPPSILPMGLLTKHQIPAIKTIGETLIPSLLRMQDPTAGIFGGLASLNAFQDWFKSIAVTLPDFTEGVNAAWPANLSPADDDFDLDLIKSLMMDEALPLAWVPRLETVKLVLAAPTRAARRSVYGRRWRGILVDCERVADQMNSVATSGYVRFLRATIKSLREGHSEAAQALAANTLDTAISEFLSRDMRVNWIGTKDRIEPDDLSVRNFFLVCQLWGIHRQFFPRNGDLVPGTFNRHGAVHGVSSRQYSRLNAVLGVAHLTSMLRAVDRLYSVRKKS